MLYTYKQLKDGVAARRGPDYVVTFRNTFITAVFLITDYNSFHHLTVSVIFIPSNPNHANQKSNKNPHIE